MHEQKIQVLHGTVSKLLRRGASTNLKKALGKIHPADIAHLFRYFELNEQKTLLSLIPDLDRTADVMAELEPESWPQLAELLDKDYLISIVHEMADDDSAVFIRSLPEELAEEILAKLHADQSEDVEHLLGYDEETAGGIMSTDVFSLDQELTVKEAIEALQDSEDYEMVFYVYVTDEHNHLVGVLSLRQLLTVPAKTKLCDIMSTNVMRVRTDMDQEVVADLVAKYNILAIPVVDDHGKLMGLITVDDVIDVMRDEATEDMLRMAGTSEDELLLGYKSFQIARLRLPWLITTLFGGVITGTLMWYFKATLEQVIMLISFIPVITGMGGNVGSQTSTILVRGFATGKIDFSMIRQVFFKELRVGLIMGAVCGLVIATVAMVWHQNYYLGLVVGLAMVTAITVAACMGVIVTAFFKRVGIDPAIASSPFVQTINDITGISIYFMMATLFLKYLI
ncbi:MAG: magnesium transporter [Deltaproteobacteria bacterium]|jgi:magnesium transporter|nr:magnesium transporter [Deltaproteobacteria bacterium]MCW9049837.1 magnesium transporter [Deltaproteobacteria bacterium]